MTTSVDPRTGILLAHKGSPVPLEPAYGTFHNTAPVDPSRQHQGSRAGALAYEREPLRPRYTEKLTKSPRYPTLAQAEQRRRNFWSKITARGGIAMMVSAPVIAVWFGTGIFPAGAFAVGGIIFIATCFVSGCCNRNRV